MRLKPLAFAALIGLTGVAQAATTITFDELAEGTVVSNQYAGLGVVFSPNAFSGAGNSSTGEDWATNTTMDVASITGTNVGGLGAPSLVSGNVLRGFSGWLAEDGDASFRIDFSSGASSFSLDMAGISTTADARVFVYNGATLLTTLAAGNTGQYRFSFAAASITHLAVAPGSFFDWVGVDNLSFTAAVPEPETYALMVLGLGLVGAVARRRRS